jgi:signal transduction histidine kinase
VKKEERQPRKVAHSDKHAIERFSEQAKFLETVLESLTHPFYVIDAEDYTIKIANSAARLGRITGTATCYALTHRKTKPCGTEAHPCPLEIAKKTKQPVTVEHVHYDQDGRARNMEVHGFPVFDRDGRIIQMIEYCLDVTERKRMEEDLRKYREHLEELVQARTTELTKVNERLVAEIERRKALERELLSVVERERQRIGQELHDSLGQQLTGIAFMMEVLGEKLTAKSLAEEAPYAEKINARVGRAVELARHLAKGLHPIDLDRGGLLPVLQTLAADTEQLFDVSCTFTSDETVSVKRIAAAINLYRIAQEAITNAVKHGRARNIRVQLSSQDGSVVLSVENDGLDFPAEPGRVEGMGLKIMRYRAELMNSSLDIHKGAHGGTTVTCVLPKQEAT